MNTAKAGNWKGVSSMVNKNLSALNSLKKFPGENKKEYAEEMKKLEDAFTPLKNAGAKKDVKIFGGAFKSFIKVFGSVYVKYL